MIDKVINYFSYIFQYRKNKLSWSILDIFYRILRPILVPNFDSNEDYYCEHCGKPVAKRYLYCSETCDLRANCMYGETRAKIAPIKPSEDFIKAIEQAGGSNEFLNKLKKDSQ